jgi:hypothetical protein
MVWELEGPMPILKISKTLKLMRTSYAAAIGAMLEYSVGKFAADAVHGSSR